MSKIGALFHNEIIKMRKRISILVIAIVMIVAIIGISGFIKLEESLNKEHTYYSYSNSYQDDMDYFKEYLTQLEADIESAKERGDTEALLMSCNEKISILTSISELELRMNYTDTAKTDFRSDLINTIRDYIQKINEYTVMEEILPGTQNKAEYEAAQQAVTELTEILKNQDYAGYAEYSKGLINAMPDITESDKKLLLEKWDIVLKLDPTGGLGENSENDQTEYARNVANTVEALAKTIIYERNFVEDYNGTNSVTPEQIETYKDKLAAIRYCIEQDIEISDTSYSNASIAYTLVSSISNSLITLLLIIIAGGMISTEISTGSIKSLIIAPVRRWKIFTSKLLALFTAAAMLTLIKYICIVGTQSLFWPDAISPYVYASAETAHSINYYLYRLIYCFAELMPIFMVAIFAFMLSVTTRNTALSVGLSMGIYFGGSIMISILNLFASGEWLKFIPFNNMNFADKLFPTLSLNMNYGNAFAGMIYGEVPSLANTSALFTFLYMIVLSGIMLYIAFDSFTRRDI